VSPPNQILPPVEDSIAQDAQRVSLRYMDTEGEYKREVQGGRGTNVGKRTTGELVRGGK
jgi:hypothetical protein